MDRLAQPIAPVIPSAVVGGLVGSVGRWVGGRGPNRARFDIATNDPHEEIESSFASPRSSIERGQLIDEPDRSGAHQVGSPRSSWRWCLGRWVDGSMGRWIQGETNVRPGSPARSHERGSSPPHHCPSTFVFARQPTGGLVHALCASRVGRRASACARNHLECDDVRYDDPDEKSSIASICIAEHSIIGGAGRAGCYGVVR